MTLRDEILANPACASAVASRNCQAIADIMSVGRTKLRSTYIGNGTVLDLMDNGGLFMDFLVAVGATNRDAYWSMDLLKAGRFDIGTQKAQEQLALMALAAPQFAPGIAKLLAFGHGPDVITPLQVANALYNE